MCDRQVSGFSAQSTIPVISGQTTIHPITSQSLLTVPDISQSLFGEVLSNKSSGMNRGKQKGKKQDREPRLVAVTEDGDQMKRGKKKRQKAQKRAIKEGREKKRNK